jgi:hypothetical protein
LHFFVTGLPPLFALAFQFYGCLIELEDTGVATECMDPGRAPGTTRMFWLLFSLDCVRLVLVWRAYTRLRRSHGGAEAIAALDTLRLDAADGEPNGSIDLARLEDDECADRIEQPASHRPGADVTSGLNRWFEQQDLLARDCAAQRGEEVAGILAALLWERAA